MKIQLAKDVYHTGEIVKGNLHTAGIACRGIYLEWSCISTCQFKITEETLENEMEYGTHRRTIFGKLVKTQTIQGGGCNPVFNPPWQKSEGVMVLQLIQNRKGIVLQVMDEDFGKKDDLLGEVYIDYQLVMMEQQPVCKRLYYQGGLTESAIVFSMDNQNRQMVKIVVHECIGLRKADFFSENDVYVQAYVADTFIDLHQPFPAYYATCTVPPEELPFQFTLPKTWPSSIRLDPQNGIRYSIYCTMDIPWSLDRSTRIDFTVLHVNSNDRRLHEPFHQTITKMVKPVCCLPPFCCWFFEVPYKTYGNVSIHVDSTQGSPLHVNLQGSNQTLHRIIPIHCSLVRITTRSAEGCTSIETKTIKQYPTLEMNPNEHFQESLSLEIPNNLPTAFQSIDSSYLDWLQVHPRKNVNMYRKDPITWTYEISIKASLSYAKHIHFHLPCNG